jgi:hypothetical protein
MVGTKPLPASASETQPIHQSEIALMIWIDPDRRVASIG